MCHRVQGLPADFKEGVVFSTYATLISSIPKGSVNFSALDTLAWFSCLLYDRRTRREGISLVSRLSVGGQEPGYATRKACTHVTNCMAMCVAYFPSFLILFCSLLFFLLPSLPSSPPSPSNIPLFLLFCSLLFFSLPSLPLLFPPLPRWTEQESSATTGGLVWRAVVQWLSYL